MSTSFKVFQDEDEKGRFRFFVKHEGKIVGWSKPYKNETACKDGIESIKENIVNAEMDEDDKEKKLKELLQDNEE